MSDFRFYDVRMLHLLWLAPLLAFVAWRAFRKRKEALRRFAAHPLITAAAGEAAGRRRFWKSAMTLAAVALLAIAIARPAWNRIPQQVTQRGRDVVFILDVSRSMLAEDLRPNRLERAKLAVQDAVSRLSGDRVALIAFAGVASVKVPLTIDYGFFRMALEDLEPDSVPRGGTMIGDAIRKAVHAVFDDKPSKYRDIILITDGEDHDSFPEDAAKEAGAKGIRLIAIGLGDENVGRRIPYTNQRGDRTFLQYKGQEVWSRLDAKTLRRMAAATPGGRYLNVATGAIDFGDIYARLVASADRRDVETRTIERYEEKFQIFAGLAFLLLLGELLIKEFKPRSEAVSEAVAAQPKAKTAARAAAVLFAVIALASAQSLQGASARSLVSEGNHSYESAKYDDALNAYREAATKDPETPTARFNEGAALYRQEHYDEAVTAYLDAAQLARESENENLEARSRFNAGNAFFQQSGAYAKSNPQEALDALRKSSGAYKQALELDPNLTAAAENLELARRTMGEILERMRKQPQQNSQNGDQSKDLSKKLQDQIQKQQQLNQDREQAKQQQNSQSQPQQQQQRQQLANRQDELQKQSEQMSQEAQQQQTPQAAQAKQHLDQASQKQKQAAEQLRQNQLDPAQDSQEQASQNLQKALDALRGEGKQGDEKQQNAQQQQRPSQQQQQQQAQQTPLQTLQLTPQDILNEEQASRRRRALEMLGQRPTVEKDW